MADLSEEPAHLNPYSPSIEVELQGGRYPGLSRLEIAAGVIFGIALSGALMGVLAALVFLSASYTSQTSDPLSQQIAMSLLVMGMACGAALFASGLTSVMVVPILMLAFRNGSVFGGSGWDRRSVANFCRLCAFFCGLWPLLLLAPTGSIQLIYGLIPGVFLAVMAPLMIRGLLRKADAFALHA